MLSFFIVTQKCHYNDWPLKDEAKASSSGLYLSLRKSWIKVSDFLVSSRQLDWIDLGLVVGWALLTTANQNKGCFVPSKKTSLWTSEVF